MTYPMHRRIGVPLVGCAALLMLAPSTAQMPEPRPFQPPPFQEIEAGLLGRTLFKAEAGATTVEFIDLIVGPGKISEPLRLSGGALLDVQAGNAALRVDDNTQQVRVGNTVSLAQNQSIAIDNSQAQRSFIARLVLFSRLDR